MSHWFTFTLATSPNATAYDAAYPTRSTELYSHACHKLLEDMSDADFYFKDGYVSTTYRDNHLEIVNEMIEDVFDYAEEAIVNFRDHGSPDLTKPDEETVRAPGDWFFDDLRTFEHELWKECMKMVWKVYYLWETEEDPLRIKDYIRDMLIAWPLNDIEIQLNEEAGKTLRVYPVWKDADI